MGVVGFLLTRLVTVVVVFLAITLGWLSQAPIHPLGRFFATVIPLMKGIMPPTVVGHGKMKGTPAVPDDMMPQPRPAAEHLLALRTNDDDKAEQAMMPANGLGMCCRPTAYDDVLAERTVLWYLLQGGRHIDGADLYLNHGAIGSALHEAERRGVPRNQVFLTTKIFPTHFGYNSTLETIPRFLQELNVTYMDMVLMHFPGTMPPLMSSNPCTAAGLNATQCRQETWRALSELRAQGLIRHVGVSNFAVRHLQDIQSLIQENDDMMAPIANNQIQYSPFAPAAVHELVAYCHQHNITVTAYSPLGGLFDREKALVVQALQVIANRYTYQDKSSSSTSDDDPPLLLPVTVSQVMLRWAVQKGLAVIPGTGNPKHMRENLAIYQFALTDADMQAIDGLQFDAQREKFFFMDISAVA